jgi:hypothetical protein
MKLKTIAIGALALSFGFMAMQWTSGYFVRLLPLSIFTPVVTLAAFLLLAMLTVGALAFLCVGKRRFRDRAAFASVISVAALLPFSTSLQLAGFEYRIRQTPEAGWQRLSDDARRLKLLSDSGQPGVGRSKLWNRHIVDGLAPSHPILSFGDFPPKLWIRDSHVGVYWGSGTIGTLAVEISVENRPAVTDGYYRSTKIYDSVTMVSE